MQLHSRTILFGGAIVGVLTLAGTLLSGSEQVAFAQQGEQSRDPLVAVSQRSDNPGIEGTWRVTVTQKICATGGAHWPALSLFADLRPWRDYDWNNGELCVPARPA